MTSINNKHARKELERNLDDVLVLELAQYLDLPDCRNWETLLLILETNLHKESYRVIFLTGPPLDLLSVGR